MSVLDGHDVLARRTARQMSGQRALRIVLQALVWVAGVVALTGCQDLARSSVAPTPTPILLAPATMPARSTELPAAVPTMAQITASSTQTPTAAATEASITPIARTPRIMALGLGPTVVLRTAPQANASVFAQVVGSEVLKAEGRSADGKWLWVAFGQDEASSAWVAAVTVKLFGEVATLPVVEKTAAIPTRSVAPAASASVAQPAMPVRLAGKIAFATAIGGDIYLVNADGSDLRLVANGMDPALSPDGTRLAYTRWGSPDGLYVLSLSTGEERRVATANHPRSPTWSPDGGQLAFIHQTGTYTCLQTPFGCLSEQTVRGLFRGQDCQVIQGKQYCISDFGVRVGQAYGLVRVDASGEGWLDVSSTTDVQSLSWTPKQAEILYRGGGGLQIAAADSAPRPLVQDAGLGSPAWSPDGQCIVVQAHVHDHADIFLLDAAGNKVARLTTPPAGAKVAPDNVAPAWSPDGKHIVFLSNRDGAWRLYRMNADGSDQEPLLPQVIGDFTLKYDFAAERVVSWSK